MLERCSWNVDVPSRPSPAVTMYEAEKSPTPSWVYVPTTSPVASANFNPRSPAVPLYILSVITVPTCISVSNVTLTLEEPLDLNASPLDEYSMVPPIIVIVPPTPVPKITSPLEGAVPEMANVNS